MKNTINVEYKEDKWKVKHKYGTFPEIDNNGCLHLIVDKSGYTRVWSAPKNISLNEERLEAIISSALVDGIIISREEAELIFSGLFPTHQRTLR